MLLIRESNCNYSAAVIQGRNAYSSLKSHVGKRFRLTRCVLAGPLSVIRTWSVTGSIKLTGDCVRFACCELETTGWDRFWGPPTLFSGYRGHF